MTCVECGEEIRPQYQAGQWVATGYECGDCGRSPICDDCMEKGFCDGEEEEPDFPSEL